MKALIAAGGHATRLRPITHTTNKHLIPIAGKPMILHAVDKLCDAEITDIFININPGEKELQKVVGDGSAFGVKITYIEQKGGALGVAHVVYNAQEYLGDEPFVFYLGDNIILGGITHLREKFEKENLNCLLALSKAHDLSRFGVPEIKDGRIIKVEEKPKNPKSEFAVTGIYFYDKHYFDAFKTLKPSSWRHEYEISELHTELIDRGLKVGYEEISGWWKDTGKPEDLLEANQLVLNDLMRQDPVQEGEIGDDVVIQGKVQIGAGTKIGPRVLIRGPVVIGKNCTIQNGYIGPYTSIGDNVEILNTELEHSVIFDGVKMNCSRRIVDSLIGLNVQVVSVNDSLPQGHKLIVGDHGVIEI
jgi:glucose-1-phosphate thymidylyltransferase